MMPKEAGLQRAFRMSASAMKKAKGIESAVPEDVKSRVMGGAARMMSRAERHPGGIEAWGKTRGAMDVARKGQALEEKLGR